MKTAIILISLVQLLVIQENAFSQTRIIYNTQQAPVSYAVNKLQGELLKKDYSLEVRSINQDVDELGEIIIINDPNIIPDEISGIINERDLESIEVEGFEHKWINQGQTLAILSSDEVGAMYGVMDLVEYIQINGDYESLPDKKIDPLMEYRIVKFNLPWSPYRVGSEAMSIHTPVVRDLNYWEAFLDMMVENRLNVLSLWNNHPFPFMIKATNFPEATPFNDREMAEWQQFWKSLFKMAKQRGIQTFIVNWNIVVSPEFAEAYGADEYSDLSEQVKRYTRESVTQLINEYEDLTGLGVTLADWMGTFDESMTPQEREDWIEDTFIEGMEMADREVKFLHRSVLAGDPDAMRELISKADFSEPVLVEIKFNWSHGHSTPNFAISHEYHSGEVDDRFWNPIPDNYNIQWMIRNEDFFILRWGQPEFIREHIAVNNHDYVNGYFIGSEGYIPALDYSHKPSPIKTWNYAFEKQWLFYRLWGRLLYNPETTNEVLASAFDVKYGRGIGDSLLTAYTLASNMPLRLASFHRSTWDYTLYSEGFISAAPAFSDVYYENDSPFISINEFIYHETLEPSFLSIPDYVELTLAEDHLSQDKVSPLALADLSEKDSREALEIIESLTSYVNDYSGSLISELDDISVWSYMGLYFADKLRAGVALEKYRQTGEVQEKEKAIRLLENCVKYWDEVIVYTKDRYNPTPHVSTERWGSEFQEFSWELLRPQVLKDVEIAKKASYEP